MTPPIQIAVQAETTPNAKEPTMTVEKYLRLPELQALVPLSRSVIYDMIARGKFPRPVKLTSRVSAWKSSEVAAWLAEREAAA